MKSFPWIIKNKETGEEVAGFYNRGLANEAADRMGVDGSFVVVENSLLDITGEMSFNANNIWFDGEYLQSRLMQELNVRLSRGNSHEFGYVRLVIKPTERPKEEQ